MHDPIRLRDDPAQPVALRAALKAEIASPIPIDLAAMKAGLGQQISAGAAPSALGLGSKVLILLGLSAIAVLWLRPTTNLAPQNVQIVAAPVVAVAPPAALAELPPSKPATLRALPEPAATVETSNPPDVEPRRQTTKARPKAPTRPAATAPNKLSGLAAQMAQYQSAQSALSEGRYVPAATHFATYLQVYPHGTLVDEATLGQLEALHRAKQPAKVVALAKTILAAERIPERHAEVLRVLGEAEVMRGHCDAARRAFEKAITLGSTIRTSTLKSALQACESRAMQ